MPKKIVNGKRKVISTWVAKFDPNAEYLATAGTEGIVRIFSISDDYRNSKKHSSHKTINLTSFPKNSASIYFHVHIKSIHSTY